MRLTLAAVALSVISVTAQDLSDLPDCGLKCIIDTFPVTGCAEATDFACVCKAADKLTDPVQVCAGQTCSMADFERLPKAMINFCAAAGVKITVDSALPPTSSSSSSPSSVSESSSAPAPATTSASATTALTSSFSSGRSTSGSSTSTPSATIEPNDGGKVDLPLVQAFLAAAVAMGVFAFAS